MDRRMGVKARLGHLHSSVESRALVNTDGFGLLATMAGSEFHSLTILLLKNVWKAAFLA